MFHECTIFYCFLQLAPLGEQCDVFRPQKRSLCKKLVPPLLSMYKSICQNLIPEVPKRIVYQKTHINLSNPLGESWGGVLPPLLSFYTFRVILGFPILQTWPVGCFRIPQKQEKIWKPLLKRDMRVEGFLTANKLAFERLCE